MNDMLEIDSNVNEETRYIIITIKDENGNPSRTIDMVKRHNTTTARNDKLF